MYPEKIENGAPEEERKRWKLVRRDSLADIPGLIVYADVLSGKAVLQQVDGTNKNIDVGPHGLLILPRGR